MLLSKTIANTLLFRILILLNVLVALGVSYFFRNHTGGDLATYSGLADGMLMGKYSYWYFVDNQYFPDTFRNPGYPLFLALIRIFSKSVIAIQLVQFILYVFSILLILDLIKMIFNKREIQNIFLLLLIPAVYVASYIPAVFPEILVTFLLLLYFWVDLKLKEKKLSKFLWLGLLAGILFQIRPVFMFIPIIHTLLQWLLDRQRFKLLRYLFFLMVYLITMIPYGYWNLKNHGVFKVTSLEGGAGVFHLGYWAMKLPDYYEGRYWNNYCSDEMIPFIAQNDRSKYIEEYNREWDQIDSLIAPYATIEDSLVLKLSEQNPGLFPTRNSRFTMKREEILKTMTIERIRSDLTWYLKVKAYSAIRLWVTGIPVKEFHEAGCLKKVQLLYPFLITLVTLLSALVFIPYLLYTVPYARGKLALILITALYFGVMHIPFTIQARYTIPVRLEVLMMIAASIYFLINRKNVLDHKE